MALANRSHAVHRARFVHRFRDAIRIEDEKVILFEVKMAYLRRVDGPGEDAEPRPRRTDQLHAAGASSRIKSSCAPANVRLPSAS